jgi:transglutaminase-like putative cysteine protease
LIRIEHKISYAYDRPVFLSPHLIRLAPYSHSHIIPGSYSLTVQPQHNLHWQQDVYGNTLARIDFEGRLQALSVEVSLGATLKSYNPFDFLIEERAKVFPFQYAPRIQKALLPYLRIDEESLVLSEYAESVSTMHQEILSFLVELNQHLCSQIRYEQRLEQGVQSCEETLLKASGSCRDSGWLMVQVLRQLGLASRFVSGYLVQVGKDNSMADLHAWAEVFIPGVGWIGLDTTSGLFTSEGHIALAVGPTPQDVIPVDGTTEPCMSTIDYQITAFEYQSE